MTVLSVLLMQPVPAPAPDAIGIGEAIAFWILGPLALAGGLGMVFARNAVHSALWLAQAMLCLGALYMVQQAPFLGFVQIIVYTGAIMMLFLFVLMLVGKESVDAVVEVLRGQRVAAALGGIALAALLVAMLGRAFNGVTSAGLVRANTVGGGNVANLGRLLFTDYLFPFELTSALLITAAVGAMVLAYTERGKQGRLTQREQVEVRIRGAHPSPLPGPGVFATLNSVATPALLPDGSPAPESRSELLESTNRARLDDDVRSVASAGAEPDTRALRAPADQEEL
ncbi:MAG: NADH-quinone oxidoreductase subunit [Pseudonocardiales bacterium]|jgi:NADH-quinone oxidoreductase subunit J|nr:NADH-quinone oxidoreductase subunit [Pseudonocardiales bacterium]